MRPTGTRALSAVFCRLALAGAVGLGSIAAWAPAAADDLQTLVGPAASKRFEAETAQLQRLAASGDVVSKLELARTLLRGTQISVSNPLVLPDLDRADALLTEVIAGPDADLVQRALALRADLLARRGTPEALEARDEINRQLVASGYPAAVADLVNSGAPLPATLSLAAATAVLEPKVLAGDANATLALSVLLATSDPERSKTLAAQGLVRQMAAASNNPKAASDLGQRYLSGTGVAQNSEQGLRLLKDAATRGSNDALQALNEDVGRGTAGIAASEFKDTIIAGLAAGSTTAAEIIVADFLERPVYGFARQDALYALALLRETGDREAVLKSAKFYASGGEAAPDLQAAIPLIEQLVETSGMPPADILRLGLKLESIGLPPALSLKYVEPLFRSIGGKGADEANFQADRILAAAADAGLDAAATLPAGRLAAILEELRAAAQRKHTRSLILLGDLYYTGIWVNTSYRQAIQYYEQALALEPTLVTKERVAKALSQLKQTPFEEQRFETLISELSASGSDWAQYRYGLLLIAGRATQPPDVAAGEKLLLTLSAKGFEPAVKAMITRLRDGHDEVRMDEAIEAFTTAWSLRKDFHVGRQLGEFYILAGRTAQARQVLGDPMFAHDPEVLLALARMEAAATPPNEQHAFALAAEGYKNAGADRVAVEIAQFLATLSLPEARTQGQQALEQMATAGNTYAVGNLVTAYIDRLKTDRNVLPRVLSWTTALARVGQVAPIIEVAATYLAAGADAEIAASVLPAAESALTLLPADSYVAVLLAEAYYNGWGTKADVAHGNALIDGAAAAGNRDALAELGLQYFYGMGRERNSEVGIALLDSAAALGHGVARVELGRLYSSATGPSVDRVKAYSMFLDAAANGSSAGMLEVGRLYLAGWGIGQDEARGVEWLERAAALDNFDAMYQLYFHYYSKPDAASQAVARQWLDRSVAAGVNPARLRLAVHLLSTGGDRPGDSGYGDAIGLLDDAFADGYNTARKFRQTTTDFDLPLSGAARAQP